MTVIGDLVVIQSVSKFKKAVDSFREKWAMATPSLTMATASASPRRRWGMASCASRARATAMETTLTTAMEKETGKQVSVKYCGYDWKDFDQIVGIITEVIPEGHPDFDVIKIREQTGGVRYCRRYIVENAQEVV